MKAINEKEEGDCRYVAFWNGKRCEVWAKTRYDAQELAAKHFKTKKTYTVSVVLAVTAGGEEVIHTPTD